MTAEHLTQPIDPTSARVLAERGLRFELVEADGESFEPWFTAVGRSFHEAPNTTVNLPARRRAFSDRRACGVWDDSAADPTMPIATASGWPTALTLPGETSVPSWAISTVTVAPTHRRRGIARELLGSELRTASALGIPVAILTASEATIYPRWGFAPAAMRADWTIDVRKAKWAGPAASGRVHFVTVEQLRDGVGRELLERVRLRTPGQIAFWDILWNRLFGLPGEEEQKHPRLVRYDDEHGRPQGFAVYGVVEGADHLYTVDVRYLVAATDDAYAGLWRYLLEIDLVTFVTAALRPIDEPLLWQVGDPRAVRKHDEGDQLWVRVLDVPAVLEGRRYAAPGRFALTVADPLGYAEGSYLVTIGDDGVARVTSGEVFDAPDAAALSMTVNELGALVLGGVSAHTLARAGRIAEHTPGAAVLLDRAFRADVAPWLSIWF